MGYFTSTVGRKQMVGLAGLGLSGFVLIHMAGNLLIFLGPQVYNKYAHALISNPAIYFFEVILVAMLVVHMVIALFLAFKNKKAKGSTYAVMGKKNRASLASRTMQFQGVVILAFLVWHLITFKYGTYYPANYDGIEMRDLFRLMEESFKNPLYVGGYLIVLVILGTHLGHGLASSFQSLGLNGVKYDFKIKYIAKAYAVLVTIGFLLPPFYIYLIY